MSVIGHIVRLSALCPLIPVHTLCVNQGWKQMHRIPPTKGKRAGIRPGTCTLIDCQLWDNPPWPQLPEVHTGANRRTVMVIFFS